MNWHDYFTYDPATGDLIWRTRVTEPTQSKRAIGRWNAMFAGRIAGSLNRYVMVRVLNRRVQAHRIIWEMHNGPIPKGMSIDHVDEIKTNNRIQNLRLASKSQNSQNITTRSTHRSDFRGVQKRGARWRSYIEAHGKRVFLGSFPTPEEAHKAYVSASLAMHGRFSIYYPSSAAPHNSDNHGKQH